MQMDDSYITLLLTTTNVEFPLAPIPPFTKILYSLQADHRFDFAARISTSENHISTVEQNCYFSFSWHTL